MNKSPSSFLAGLIAFAWAAAIASAGPTPAQAQVEVAGDDAAVLAAVPEGTILTPGSSIVRPGDRGARAHTHVHLFVPHGQVTANLLAPSGNFETPASLACAYGLTTRVPGCNPKTLTATATGGSRAIAIVDAYDYPTAAADLRVYSAKFGLPAITAANFQVVYAGGSKPPRDSTGGWELEAALDIEMAHALAPHAQIFLVEAASNSIVDLIVAEKAAATLVAAAGGGEVSNSWGSGEFAGEQTYEASFAAAGVVFLASAGDSPGTEFPSVLTNVVAVGGTTLTRTAVGNLTGEKSWAATGGGISSLIVRPAYQTAVANVVGGARGVPDVALDADPASGVWVYDTTPYGGVAPRWIVVGGTSVASPATAAIINNAASFNVSSVAELREVYANRANTAAFTDITKGPCSNGKGTTATVGYDLCTGVGSSLGTEGK